MHSAYATRCPTHMTLGCSGQVVEEVADRYLAVMDDLCRFLIDGDEITVSDLAETTGWLRMQSVTLRRSSKQEQLIADVCVTHGVDFYRGMLQARCRSGDELAQVVMRVAQASLRVSDLWFTLRTRAVQSITDDVADF